VYSRLFFGLLRNCLTITSAEWYLLLGWCVLDWSTGVPVTGSRYVSLQHCERLSSRGLMLVAVLTE
jgi:hypothetical protein